MTYIRSLFILLLICTTFLAFGQDYVNKNWAIKISPQHFITNTLKIEVERSITPQKISVIASPFFTIGDIWGNHRDDEIWGTGSELMARFYFAKANRSLKGFYSNFGFNYNYYNIKTQYQGWQPYEMDDLQYLKYSKINENIEINSVGFLLMLGYQLNFNNTILFDFYQGIGMKKTFSPNGEDALRRYHKNFLDYGFSGIDPRIGVKIGFVL